MPREPTGEGTEEVKDGNILPINGGWREVNIGLLGTEGA